MKGHSIYWILMIQPESLTLCQRRDKELMKSSVSFHVLTKRAPCIYYGTEIGMTGPLMILTVENVWYGEKDQQDLGVEGVRKKN